MCQNVTIQTLENCIKKIKIKKNENVAICNLVAMQLFKLWHYWFGMFNLLYTFLRQVHMGGTPSRQSSNSAREMNNRLMAARRNQYWIKEEEQEWLESIPVNSSNVKRGTFEKHNREYLCLYVNFVLNKKKKKKYSIVIITWAVM